MKQHVNYEQIKEMVIDILPDLGKFDIVVSVSPNGDTVSQIISNQTDTQIVHISELTKVNHDVKYLIVNSYIKKDDTDDHILDMFSGTNHLYYSVVVDLNNTNNHWDICSMRTFDEIVFPWDKE